jgi:hypothetical protein
MHAALNVVEVFLKKYLLVAALLMLLAVLCLWLAATPVYREYWETKKAGVPPISPIVESLAAPSEDTEVWVCWLKTGFSVFTKGKEDIFRGEIPRLDRTEPLSESVFGFLQEEIRTTAKTRRANAWNGLSWSMRYFVLDSYYSRTFVKNLCSPEVLSLMEIQYFYPNYAAHPGVMALGRNFVWHESIMVEIGLADLFEESPGREWFEVLEKEVEANLMLMDEYLEYQLPFEEFDQFLIAEEGLKIIFQPYAISGPFDNVVEVVVSWDLMAPFLKPGAPVTIWYEKQLQKQLQKQ